MTLAHVGDIFLTVSAVLWAVLSIPPGKPKSLGKVGAIFAGLAVVVALVLLIFFVANLLIDLTSGPNIGLGFGAELGEKLLMLGVAACIITYAVKETTWARPIN
ncbi:MAG: hypothetical protein Q4A71_01785 [Actinomycetaceae bacterium]|nr:hypothetical protein [Actinomycetaceae bacterium]